MIFKPSLFFRDGFVVLVLHKESIAYRHLSDLLGNLRSTIFLVYYKRRNFLVIFIQTLLTKVRKFVIMTMVSKVCLSYIPPAVIMQIKHHEDPIRGFLNGWLI